jgi:hypothetical protein
MRMASFLAAPESHKNHPAGTRKACSPTRLAWVPFVHLAVTHLRYHSSTHEFVHDECSETQGREALILRANCGYSTPRAASIAGRPSIPEEPLAAEEL